MKNWIFRKTIFITLFWFIFFNITCGQGTYINFNSIPTHGTILIYSHQDDDVIWMLPWWNITDKFIGGAMPSTEIYDEVIPQQQAYMDSHGYNIDYESNWFVPWGRITHYEYLKYYVTKIQLLLIWTLII